MILRMCDPFGCRGAEPRWPVPRGSVPRRTGAPANGGLLVAPDRAGDAGRVLHVTPVLIAERVVPAPGDRVVAAEQLAQRRAEPGVRGLVGVQQRAARDVR